MLFVVLCLIFAACLWRCKVKRSHYREPPTLPGGWPVLGHVPLIIGNSCDLWNSVTKLAYQSNSVGGVVTLSIGPRTVYVVTDPDDAFTVANACLRKDKFYDFAKPWLGEGLVTGHRSTWKHHRKLLQPTFRQVVLDGFMGVFNKQSRKLVKHLEVEVGRAPFDHWKYTRLSSLETICMTALGVDFTDRNLNSGYVEAAEVIFNTMVERFQKVWLHSPLLFKYSAVKKTQDDCLKILHNMSDTVLQKRKTEIDNRNRMDVNNNESLENSINFKPFLDLLLEHSSQVFSDREIRNHVDTMIVGGHDTTATVLMFTLLLLGSHPVVQEKLYQELQDVFNGSDRDVEKADLPKLVYLEAVLKESMRVHCVVPITARWLDKDVQLKNCTLQSKRTCFILVLGVHRHAVWGSDAAHFRPERWLDAASLPENPNAFTAFLTGRRVCIGKTYAYMSMKTTLAHVMRRYRVRADDSNLVLKLDVMLKPAAGYYISIEDRL